MAYDRNPFHDNLNPFANPEPSALNSVLSPLPSERADYNRGATLDIPLHDGQDWKNKEKNLLAKEVELKKKEQELKRREDAIARAGIVIEEKNWPPFFPLIHHDIPNEIPIHLQKLQYVAFTTYIGLFLCLLWNIVAVTVAWIKGEGVEIWLLSIIYFICGVPGSYVFWYRPLYRAMRTESALKVGWFFIAYTVHLIFCGLAAIAPPFVFEDKSLTGLSSAIDVLNDNAIVGILYFIGFGLFVLEMLLSFWVYQQVYMYFRESGKDAEIKTYAARQTIMAAL
ncbi:unnamed protein product [Amaranthus hypochondriacus]